MDKSQTFEQFLMSSKPTIALLDVGINLALTAIFCLILSFIFVRFGRSMSNRNTLARNLILIGMTTMLIITIVKSSLALSLGLVGALSIIRFRTAIKEPEELAYLFLTIAVGLGFGADQRMVTSALFVGIVGILIVHSTLTAKADKSNLYLTIQSEDPKSVSINMVSDKLRQYCSELAIKRFDESEDSMEVAYLVKFKDYQQLEQAKVDLQKCNDRMRISFVDYEGAA